MPEPTFPVDVSRLRDKAWESYLDVCHSRMRWQQPTSEITCNSNFGVLRELVMEVLHQSIQRLRRPEDLPPDEPLVCLADDAMWSEVSRLLGLNRPSHSIINSLLINCIFALGTFFVVDRLTPPNQLWFFSQDLTRVGVIKDLVDSK